MIRKPLQRSVPLQSDPEKVRAWKQQRKPLAKRSKKKSEPERYRDCHGIAFDEYRLWLPASTKDWRGVVRVKNLSVCELMHERFGRCFNCFQRPWWPVNVEAHHICGGTVGRSDELTNIAMLCQLCHPNANTDALPLGRILWLKWKHDRETIDWVRLALLRRKFLPDLICE